MGKLFLLLLLLVLLTAPAMLSANGGDQRVVDEQYLINLSRAPFTPLVGVKTSMLASFVDIGKDTLIAEDLIVKVRIAKLGGGQSTREFLFENDSVVVKGGVLELSYTFAESGLHEIFFDFAFASNPQKMYETPDFLLDVQEPPTGYNTNQILMAAIGSFVIGLVAGWFAKRIVSSEVG